MNTRHFSFRAHVAASICGCALLAGFCAKVNAASTIVDDITDWNTTPMELVDASIPGLNYSGPLYAGINTITVTTGANTTVDSAFCIDPFHWSAGGPTPGYSVVSLSQAPKPPGTLDAYTATEIEDLWEEFYSPTMNSPSAAGLQIAIWELVSSNAVATYELPADEEVTFSGNTYTAAADLASLAGYTGPAADLVGLTGPGQDYAIEAPGKIGGSKFITTSVPDGGGTLMMLVLTVGTLIFSRSALLQRMELVPAMQTKPVGRSV